LQNYGSLGESLSQKSQQSIRKSRDVYLVTDGDATVPKLEVAVSINDTKVMVELDTATAGNFLSLQDWERLGKPELSEVQTKYQSASKHVLLIRGRFESTTSCGEHKINLKFLVAEVPGLNVLGRDAIKALGISVDKFLFFRAQAVASSSVIDHDLQAACSKLCDEYAELFKLELRCLRDVEFGG